MGLGPGSNMDHIYLGDAKTPLSLGGTPSLGRPRERRPLFGGVYVLVPIWLGAPRPAWRPDRLMKRGLPGFLGRYLVTVYVRMWFFYFLEFCALYL